MEYKIVGILERNAVDTFNLTIEAEDPEEAQDVAYEVLSNYPNSEIPVKKLLRVHTAPERPTSIVIEFQRDELETAEEVFSDGDDPERA
jgi:hypothetical protein